MTIETLSLSPPLAPSLSLLLAFLSSAEIQTLTKILGRNPNTNQNGGVNIDYSYSNLFPLANSEDEIIIIDNKTEIDRVFYNKTDLPLTPGSSFALKQPNLDNNNPANWQQSDTPYGDGDFGTPGSTNFPTPTPTNTPTPTQTLTPTPAPTSTLTPTPTPTLTPTPTPQPTPQPSTTLAPSPKPTIPPRIQDIIKKTRQTIQEEIRQIKTILKNIFKLYPILPPKTSPKKSPYSIQKPPALPFSHKLLPPRQWSY